MGKVKGTYTKKTKTKSYVKKAQTDAQTVENSQRIRGDAYVSACGH